MNIPRLFRHLVASPWQVRRTFPVQAIRNIEAVIHDAEQAHHGEIRFAVEAGLEIGPLLRDQTARDRAIEVFSNSRTWDTEQNNGVLIYLLLADRDMEIVVDRGIDKNVGHAVWEEICRDMEAMFRDGHFEEGVMAGIRAVSGHLKRHYPKHGEDSNELPDMPVTL